MLYEIIKDCRIANKDFKKGDVVSIEEVGNYYTSVMRPIDGKPVKKAAEKAVEKKTDDSEKVSDGENRTDDEDKKADEEKAAKEEAKKGQSKKK